jgi:hypothetical protein
MVLSAFALNQSRLRANPNTQPYNYALIVPHALHVVVFWPNCKQAKISGKRTLG